ncbi:hypothetical protein [Chryseobacterium sp.]|uniref:hypothetical protein n=1 Tax=Chryseobacterium sp. TaxID=1871047 RepID=UPI00289E2D13|nr:hypothetical protein [Chryseobacterium sp.]
MKITFENSGTKHEIKTNDHGMFKQLLDEINSILNDDSPVKYVTFMESNLIDRRFPADFIKNSIIITDYSNHP